MPTAGKFVTYLLAAKVIDRSQMDAVPNKSDGLPASVRVSRTRWLKSERGRHRVPVFVLSAFVLLFPGYFFYWWLVGTGSVPRFLGGYAVSMSALCIAGALPFLCLGRYRVNFIDVQVGAFVSVMFIYALSGIAVGAPQDVSNSYVAYVLHWSAMFLVFRGVQHLDARCAVVLKLSFLVMLFSLGSFLSRGALLFEDGPVSAENFPTYQAFAVYFVVCSSLMIASMRSTIIRIGAALLSVVFLAVLGARSELVLFIVFAMFSEAVRGGLVGAFVFFGLLLSGLAIAMNFAATLEGNRVLYWINAWLEYGSLNTDAGRTALNQLGLSTIASNPFLGSYGYYSEGGYAHNILSVWAELGLVPFIWYCGAIGLAGWVVLRSRKRLTDRGLWAAVLGLYVGTVLLLLTTKSFGYQMVPVILGLAAGFICDGGRSSARLPPRGSYSLVARGERVAGC